MLEEGPGRAFQRHFFARYPSLKPLMDLYEHAPGIYFHAKDRESRFVRLNRANVGLYGLDDEDLLLGRSDRDFHPHHLAEGYIAEDKRVMKDGPVFNQTWLVPFFNGQMQWFISSKMPLVGPRGERIGVCGVMYPIATPMDQLKRFNRIAPAIRYLEHHFREHVQLADLIHSCGLSATQIHRLFQRLLRMSPTEYVLALRMQEARRLLSTTDLPLSAIAVSTGFFDQSHFTKRFQKVTGITPTKFRKAFR